MMYLKGKWLRESVIPYDTWRNSSRITPANMATGSLIPMIRITKIIHGNADSNSAKTEPVLPPINWKRFFFQPSHIAENERYMRTRTIPNPEANQMRNPADFTRRARPNLRGPRRELQHDRQRHRRFRV